MDQCFYECLECIGKNCLTQNHMAAFIESARSVLVDYQERVKDRLEEQAENEDGEEATEEMLFAIEDDQNLLSDMNKVSIYFPMLRTPNLTIARLSTPSSRTWAHNSCLTGKS